MSEVPDLVCAGKYVVARRLSNLDEPGQSRICVKIDSLEVEIKGTPAHVSRALDAVLIEFREDVRTIVGTMAFEAQQELRSE